MSLSAPPSSSLPGLADWSTLFDNLEHLRGDEAPLGQCGYLARVSGLVL